MNSNNPIQCEFLFVCLLLQSYNEHLLKIALQCLIGVSYTSNNDIKSLECNDATVIRDVLNYSELLKESKSCVVFLFGFIFYYLFLFLLASFSYFYCHFLSDVIF